MGCPINSVNRKRQLSGLVTVKAFPGLVDHHPALGLPLGGTGIALWPVPSPETPLKSIAGLTERSLPQVRFWLGAFLDVARKGQAKRPSTQTITGPDWSAIASNRPRTGLLSADAPDAVSELLILEQAGPIGRSEMPA